MGDSSQNCRLTGLGIVNGDTALVATFREGGFNRYTKLSERDSKLHHIGVGVYQMEMQDIEHDMYDEVDQYRNCGGHYFHHKYCSEILLKYKNRRFISEGVVKKFKEHRCTYGEIILVAQELFYLTYIARMPQGSDDWVGCQYIERNELKLQYLLGMAKIKYAIWNYFLDITRDTRNYWTWTIKYKIKRMIKNILHKEKR